MCKVAQCQSLVKCQATQLGIYEPIICNGRLGVKVCETRVMGIMISKFHVRITLCMDKCRGYLESKAVAV